MLIGAVAVVTSTAAAEAKLALAVAVTDDGGHSESTTDKSSDNGMVRQGDQVSYAVTLDPGDTTLHEVSLTMTATPAWAASGLKLSGCPGAVSGTTCTVGELSSEKTIEATIEVPASAAKGSALTVTATAKSKETGVVEAPEAASTKVVAEGETESPTPTETSSSPSDPTPSESSSTTKPPSTSDGDDGSSSGGDDSSNSDESNGGSGGDSSSADDTSSTDGSDASGGTGVGGDLPTDLPSGVDSSISGMSSSTAPYPQVASPPSSSSPGPVELTHGGGQVHPISQKVPLAAIGFALILFSAYHLLRRLRDRFVPQK